MKLRFMAKGQEVTLETNEESVLGLDVLQSDASELLLRRYIPEKYGQYIQEQILLKSRIDRLKRENHG